MTALLAPQQRVLVRVPSWLGDAVMAEPVLRALHAHHDAAGARGRVSLAGPARLLALFQDRFDGALRIESRGGRDRARDWSGHDVALLLTGSFRSGWCAWRAGIPLRAGWARDGRGVLLSRAARPAREVGGTPLGLGRPGRWPRVLPRPFGAACVELASLVGLSVADPRPRLEPTARGDGAARARLERLGLGPAEPFALASVGGRPGSAKAWPPDLWARALGAFAGGSGLPVVLACGPGEEQALAEVERRAPGAALRSCGAPPPELAELVALCARAELVLAADSGPRHVAAAVGAPVVAVAGPTDPRHTADHLETTRILRHQVPCGPCHRERCPLEGAARHACMLGVDPELVARAALALLARGEPAAARAPALH